MLHDFHGHLKFGFSALWNPLDCISWISFADSDSTAKSTEICNFHMIEVGYIKYNYSNFEYKGKTIDMRRISTTMNFKGLSSYFLFWSDMKQNILWFYFLFFKIPFFSFPIFVGLSTCAPFFIVLLFIVQNYSRSQ